MTQIWDEETQGPQPHLCAGCTAGDCQRHAGPAPDDGGTRCAYCGAEQGRPDHKTRADCKRILKQLEQDARHDAVQTYMAEVQPISAGWVSVGGIGEASTPTSTASDTASSTANAYATQPTSKP